MENKLNELMQELKEYQIGTVKKDEPLARHTTMKIGGPADLFIEPTSIEEFGKRRWNLCKNIMLIGGQ